MKECALFCETLIRRNNPNNPMGGTSMAFIRKQEAEENWVCFSCGSRCSPHILLSLLEPGLKGYRTLAILKLQSRNGCSTGAWKPGPKCLYKQLHPGHLLPGVWPACPFHPLLYGVQSPHSYSELLLLFFATREDMFHNPREKSGGIAFSMVTSM